MKLRAKTLAMTISGVLFGTALTAPLHAETLKGHAPIILTLMTHTDGRYVPPASPEAAAEFARDMTRINFGIDLYGLDVKMNVEASMDFANRDTIGFLADVVSRGHGVGTHCNNVDPTGITSVAALQQLISDNKVAVDRRVPVGTNVSISGICTDQDWVTAAAGAGFQIADGTVAYCYLWMPASARPAGLTDALITSTYYHDSAPFGFHNRVSPIRLQDAADFASDFPGILTLSNGGLGELASLSEGRITCGTSCVLDSADFEVVYTAIETVKALKGPREIGRINIHVPTTLLLESNRALLTSFLGRLRMYAAANTIVFGTEKDVSETYDYWRP